jgi:signal transduction histidine kinase
VTVRRNGSRVIVDVVDDGIGGADPTHGSGLIGLSDRIGALDGTLDVRSPPGGGTRLHIELPCSPSPS